jgi:ABC-type taurine transport system substrate-binding protein
MQATRAWLGGGNNSKTVLALENTAQFLKKIGVIKKVLPEYTHGVSDLWIKSAIEEST